MIINHLSVSAARMYQRCPSQYEWRYVKGKKIAPFARLVQGRAFHSSAEFYYRSVLEKYRRPKSAAVAEYFAESFDEGHRKEEVIYTKDDKKPALLDQGVTLARMYTRDIGCRIVPQTVEKRFNIATSQANFTFMGRMDLTTRSGALADIKLRSRMIPAADLAGDIQLTGYNIAHRVIFGRAPKKIEIHLALKTKEPRVVRLETFRTAYQEDIFWAILADVRRAIEAEAFPKITEGWHCSPNWCGYYPYCIGGAKL